MTSRAIRLLVLLCAVGASAPALAMGPFHENPPEVVKGMTALEADDPKAALDAFDAAAARLGSRPELEHNRALALSRMGKRDEATAIFEQLSRDPSVPKALRAKAAYQLGNVHAAASERQEAMAAYRRALTLDPTDADARHNLEVLLRNVQPPQDSPQPDGGTPEPDAGEPDAGQDAGDDAGQDAGEDAGEDAGQDGGEQDGGEQDGGEQDGGEDGGSDAGEDAGTDGGEDGGTDGGEDGGEDGGSDGGQDGGESDAGDDAGEADAGSDGGEGDAGEDAGVDGGDEGQDAGDDAGSDGGTSPDAGQDAGADSQGAQGADAEPLDPEALTEDEAEQLLDAMKQDERNLQLWRFQRKVRPRNADQKDW